MTKKLTFGRIASGAAILLLMGSAPLVFAPSTMAAMDAYLHFPGIDGGSKDAGHMNWVSSSVVSGDLDGDAAADRDASSPAMSEMTTTKNIGSQPSGSGAGKAVASPRDSATGMASGKRMHKPFVIIKETDSSSPLLMRASSSGQHFNEVDVDMGGKHYKLSDVTITATADAKSMGSAHATESLTVRYEKIEMK